MSWSRKVPAASIDGYSKNPTYKQTFFHHPTRNKHCELQYEMRLSKKQIKTFHPKKKSECQNLMHQSFNNPLSHNFSHHEKTQYPAGDRKKGVHPYSGKATDPLTLSYEISKPQTKFTRPFQATLDSAKDVERRHVLPVQREFSRSSRHYHSQIGLSPSIDKRVVTKPALNNSNNMRSTLHYQNSAVMRKASCYDDFKYNSRK